MESKYYTPTKQEIIEHFINEGYIETTDDQISRVVSSGGIVDNLYRFIEMNDKSSVYGFDINPKLYRIKYLDQEDIESCGFKLVDLANGPYSSYKGSSLVFNMSHPRKSNITIQLYFTKDRIIHIKVKESNVTFFIGIIKNKSELKKILKIIGVIE